MPTDQTPDKLPPVAGAGEGGSQETPTPESDAALVDALAAEYEQVTPEETPEVTTTADTPKPDAAPEVVPKVPEEKPAEPAPDKPEVKAEVQAVEPEIPEVLHPYDEQDDPKPKDFIDPKFTKINENVERLRNKLRKAREDGAFGQTLVKVAQQSGVAPDVLAAMVQREIRLNQGDPNAIAEFAAELQKRGYTFANQQEAKPSVDTEADKIYKEHFEPGVRAQRMDEDYAREQSKVMAERSVKARPAPAPIPQPQIQQQPSQDFAIQTAATRVNTIAQQIEANYQKAGLDFKPVYEEVKQRISNRNAKEGIPPPQMWEYTFTETVRQVQSEMAAKKVAQIQKPTVKPTNTLSPTTQSNISKTPVSEEEHTSKLVDELYSELTH